MTTGTLKFEVIGEHDETYDVVIGRDPANSANLFAACSCDESMHGNFCSHRFDILEGNHSNIASENVDDLETLREWIKGSDIESAMIALSKAKTELLTARERVAYCRKMLVKRMMD